MEDHVYWPCHMTLTHNNVTSIWNMPVRNSLHNATLEEILRRRTLVLHLFSSLHSAWSVSSSSSCGNSRQDLKANQKSYILSTSSHTDFSSPSPGTGCLTDQRLFLLKAGPNTCKLNETIAEAWRYWSLNNTLLARSWYTVLGTSFEWSFL